MDALLLASGLVAFPPAMLVFFLYLDPYYEKLKEEWVFFAFIFGIFMGLFGGAYHLAAWIVWGSMFYIPPFDVILFTFFLSAKRFVGKRRTVYYGLAMGIGYMTMVLLMYIAFMFTAGGSNIWSVLVALVVALPFAVTYGAIGAYVGQGAAVDQRGKHGFRGILMLLPLFVFIDMFAWVDGIALAAPALGMFVYAAFLYNFTTETVLPMGMIKRRTRGRGQGRRPRQGPGKRAR